MKNILRRIFLISIVAYVITHPIAADTTDAEWTQKEEVKLEWGDRFSTGNYTILAESFDKKAVYTMLVIYKNQEELQRVILTKGETFQVSTIKLSINSIGGCDDETQTPYAEMTVYTMSTPALSLEVENNMTAEGLMNISFILENTGGIRFTNISLEVSLPNDLIPYRGEYNKYQTSFDSLVSRKNDSLLSVLFENVSVRSKVVTWVQVEVPALPESLDVSIYSNVLGYDIDNRSYYFSEIINTTIEPVINVTKVPIRKIVNSSGDYFNMGDRLYVMVKIHNSATTDALDLTINETIMTRNFIMDPDSTLDYTIDLPAHQSEIFTYFLKPVRPGEVRLSATEVSRVYKGHKYSVTFNSTTAMIYGPYFEISKTLDNNEVRPGDLIKVTVVAQNMGNHAGYLELEDEIPYFAQFTDGTLNSNGIVKPGGNLSINYTLKLNKTGKFRFPHAYGGYISNDFKGDAYSTRPMINVLEHTSTPTPVTVETIELNDSGNKTNESESNDKSGINGLNFFSNMVILIISYLTRKSFLRSD